jgi:hypothetical protein
VDDYDVMVQRFQNRVSRIFFDQHKEESWLKEAYHPEFLEAQHEALCQATALRVSEWKERAARGELADTTYDSSTKPPLFFEKEDKKTSDTILFATGISAKSSTAQVQALAAQAGGEGNLVSTIVSSPNPGNNFLRTAWMEFSDADSAAKCLREMDGALLEGTPVKIVFSQINSLPAFLPPFAATEERLKHDSQQGRKTVLFNL